jgi:hypothetical protein
MSTDDLPGRLRAFATRVEDTTRPITVDDIEAHRVPRVARSRRRVSVAILAAAIVVSLASAMLVVQRGGHHRTRVIDQTRLVSMAPAPLEGREDVSSVWTGRELIVWGGASFAGSGASVTWHAFRDGAAYNPRTNRWRRIAAGPLAARDGATTTWTGRAMFVWGGFDPEHNRWYSDGALYDPAADQWRLVADPPLPGSQSSVAVWTGREVMIFTGVQNRVAAFDPVANRWRVLPDPPLPTGLLSNAVWTGTEMIVTVGGQSGLHAAAYRPSANLWARLPDPPLPNLASPTEEVWTGRALLQFFPLNIDGFNWALAYVPGDPLWRGLAAPPLTPAGPLGPPVWTGREALLVGVDRGLAYDPTRNSWRVLPALHLTPRGGGVSLWAERELLVWGGLALDDQHALNDGVRYTPGTPTTFG